MNERTEPVPAGEAVSTVATTDADEHESRELERAWGGRPGFYGWLTSVDHKSIGKRFVVTALIFFLLGGLEAATMRLQLARPENNVVGPDLYSQLFSMHGTTMMFLFAVPVMDALGLYLVPLMVGTRNVAYPRLNAYGYWVFLIGALLLYTGFSFNTGPEAGWFSYVPLAGPSYSPGKRIDVWAQTVTFSEIAALVAAVELIVTIFKLRAPGMSINRMPLFVWAMLVTGFLILFAMTTVAVAGLFLAGDRLIGTHFYNPAEGGDPLLWQHLFWYFAHPEVYIMFIPATGIVSSIVIAHARRPVFGYTALVLSTVATGFIGYGVWVHHMFATGLPQLGLSFFTAASMLITIPSGIQIFCWIATLWDGKPRLETPLLFVLGFIFIFVIGGLTGVMVASVPLDLQAHDSFFVVAHLHYVLLGGVVFPLFGGIYHWFPKWTGRMLSETAGKWNFALLFLGVNLTFFPMHFLGVQGMPRRNYTYLAESGWGDLNLLSSIGVPFIAAGVLVFLGNVLWSRTNGRVAGDNPWDADSLEWGTRSPPPPYGHLRIPFVQGRYALWSRTPDAPIVTGLRTDRPEVLVTTTLDALPDNRKHQPGPTIAPLLLALATGVTFIVAIFTPWGVPIGMALALPAALLWGWPRRKEAKPDEIVEEHP